jgi:flagellar hook assembly protein FlgD
LPNAIPWHGQTLRVYRNGIDSGTVTGNEITLTTSVNETIHIAPDGISYGEIVARMNMPGGTVTGVAGSSYRGQHEVSLTIKKEGIPGRTITFAATNAFNDTKRMTVRIYSVNGKLIKELFSKGNVVRWDMTDAGNDRVPIGAYVWKINLERGNEEVVKTGILEVER